jgi:uncharacterized beta-barrel protein YwiB (DUF1934 family)
MSSSWADRTNLSRVAMGAIIFDLETKLNSIQYRSLTPETQVQKAFDFAPVTQHMMLRETR